MTALQAIGPYRWSQGDGSYHRRRAVPADVWFPIANRSSRRLDSCRMQQRYCDEVSIVNPAAVVGCSRAPLLSLLIQSLQRPATPLYHLGTAHRRQPPSQDLVFCLVAGRPSAVNGPLVIGSFIPCVSSW
jgi:hypothetical protein